MNSEAMGEVRPFWVAGRGSFDYCLEARMGAFRRLLRRPSGIALRIGLLMLKFITDRDLYEEVIGGIVPEAREFLWLATADLKDMYVERGGSMAPLLGVLSSLADRRVAIRLLHAKEPGRAFRRDFDKYPNLITGMERILCPRVHFKCVVADGRIAYSGSANLTGAGLGAKSAHRRNFESGIVTDDSTIVSAVMEQFDNVWRGAYCRGCGRQQYCADYKDMQGG